LVLGVVFTSFVPKIVSENVSKRIVLKKFIGIVVIFVGIVMIMML